MIALVTMYGIIGSVIRVGMIVMLPGFSAQCCFIRRRVRLRRVYPRDLLIPILDDGALHAVAVIAPTGVAMPRTAAVGAIFGFFLCLAMSALVGFDQRLTVGDRNLIIVRMDFAERQETVPISSVFDKRGLQRRLNPGDLGQIDVATQLFALS